MDERENYPKTEYVELPDIRLVFRESADGDMEYQGWYIP